MLLHATPVHVASAVQHNRMMVWLLQPATGSAQPGPDDQKIDGQGALPIEENDLVVDGTRVLNQTYEVQASVGQGVDGMVLRCGVRGHRDQVVAVKEFMNEVR